MSPRRLIPDTQLQFSADLAAAIGLEEAVLVQQLKTLYLHQSAVRRDGADWLHLSHAYLLDLLPFWDSPALQRICRSLEGTGLIRVDRDNAAPDCLLLAISDTAGQPPEERTPAHRKHERPDSSAARPASAPAGSAVTAAPKRGGGEPLPPDFKPSDDMLELLERFHGIPRRFALAQLEDFTLYWRERGSANHAWQNKFKQHVEFQWARYQQETTGHGEKRGTGAARRTRDSSLEHDLTDTSWAD